MANVAKTACFYCSAAALLVFLNAQFAQAQNEKRPDGFYSRGFVTGTMRPPVNETSQAEPASATRHAAIDDSSHKAAGNKTANNQVEPGEDSIIARSAPWFAQEAEEPENRAQDSPQSVMDQTAGQPIIAVSAVLNSVEQSHFNKYLRQLSEIAEQNSLKVRAIYAVGRIPDPADAEFMHTMAAILKNNFTTLEVVNEPPPQLNTGLSPTWLIETRQGTVVLEAVSALQRYINSKGQFVEPQ